MMTVILEGGSLGNGIAFSGAVCYNIFIRLIVSLPYKLEICLNEKVYDIAGRIIIWKTRSVKLNRMYLRGI